MEDWRIRRLLRSNAVTRRAFLDVYAADRLPHTLYRYPAALVVNLDPHGRPGTHWVGIYARSAREALYFDSYAAVDDFLQYGC